ncbi:MAG: flippase-like domain-containing protein [Candidatus Delongbacteria bacterium]|nr:flippase-like domain-containing protein [Candidatus Delongbacteria bacterium]MCG2760136.1 flippase-like domain-containing protein [Candidatus Delongbacteria bacterium]
MKKNISKYLRIAVSIVLLFYLFYYLVDFNNLINILRSIKTGYLFLAILFFIMSIFAAAYRWQFVIAIKDRKMSYKACLREYFIGTFFNNFLPGSIGGDITRIIGASKEIDSKEIALSSVVVERVIGLISLLTIGLLGFMLLNISSGQGYLGISIILLATLTLSLFAVINKRTNIALCEIIDTYLPKKISESILVYLKDFADYSSSIIKLFYVFVISFSFKIFDGFFVFFILKSLDLNLTYAHAVALFSIINVIKMIPISFNGLGLSAISWVIILKSFDINKDIAASIDFLTITISLVISGYGGFLYFFGSYKKNIANGPD